jgi:hypothetical protein
MSLAGLLADLTPVSLEDLDTRAALQRRVDNKYLVPGDQLERLVGALAGDHDALEIDGRRAFRYESVYFDTPDLQSFWAHVEDRAPRHKIRSRLYVDSGACTFELKLKNADGETTKHALDQPPADHGRISPAALEFLREHLGEVPELAPSLVTRFRRGTLAARDGAERITCDAAIELCRPGGRGVRLVGDHVVVETKSEDGEARADRLLRAGGLEPVSLSKYRTGIALLAAQDPEPQLGGTPERWFRPAALA